MTRQTIKFPYRWAYELTPWGATVGRRDADDRQLAHVTLPAGWTTSRGTAHGVPGALHDQHGRVRVAINWISSDAKVTPDVTIHQPDVHAAEVAAGAPLVLDSWAQPHLMIGTAAERVSTFHDLIALAVADIEEWQDEQPQHAARLATQLRGYAEKLVAWQELFDQLATEIRSGWTIRRANAA